MSNRMTHSSPLDIDPELNDIARMLNDVADGIRVDPAFETNLERRLLASRSSARVLPWFAVQKIAPALLWIAAAALLVLILDWAIRSLAPQPVPAARNTPVSTAPAPAPPVDQSTPVPSGKSYDWHGTTLHLNAPLPDSPSAADVYLVKSDQHATVEEAIALAQRFGIAGSVYRAPGELPDTTDYMVTDGRQSLHVRSAHYFSYTADVVKSFNNFSAVQNPDAELIIRRFLDSHGLAFPSRIEWSEFRGGYVVEPLAADGSPLQYEFYAPPILFVTLDEHGQIASLQASLLDVGSDPVGQYSILSADEALQRLLDPSQFNGMVESMHSGAAPIQQWNRSYPQDQALTIYGNVSSIPAVDAAQPALIQIDGFPVTGQVSGLDKFSQPTYVEATGQFVSDNGIEKFNVDSWQVSPVNEDGLVGTLQREGGQVTIFAQDGATYILPDVPADIPMPFENAYVVGTRTGDVFQWKLIDNRAGSGGGGGGGGGGSGFYKLNLTGTAVPFPSPTQPSPASRQPGAGETQYTVQAGDTLGTIAYAYGTNVDTLMRANGITDLATLTIGQTLLIPGAGARPVEGLRGILNITISKQQSGGQTVAYGFLANATHEPGGYMLLKGDNLQALQAYNSRPVDVWGSLDASLDNGVPVIKVDRFEIPFPDLKVQVLHGTQKLTRLAGQPATLLISAEGKTYVQLLADGTTGGSLIGSEGDQVQIESIAIPGESLGGYPALRVFGGTLAIDPKTGLHMNLPITADQPTVVELPFIDKTSTAPTATIEKIELVHFISDPRYAVPVANAQPAYVQPVWRFYGHYSNGDGFEILVQALRDQYLLPELEPYLQGG